MVEEQDLSELRHGWHEPITHNPLSGLLDSVLVPMLLTLG